MTSPLNLAIYTRSATCRTAVPERAAAGEAGSGNKMESFTMSGEGWAYGPWKPVALKREPPPTREENRFRPPAA